MGRLPVRLAFAIFVVALVALSGAPVAAAETSSDAVDPDATAGSAEPDPTGSPCRPYCAMDGSG